MRVVQLGKYYYPFMGGIETHLEVLCRGLGARADVEAVVFNTEARTTREVIDGVRVTRCAQLVRLASNSISLAMVSELSRREYDILHLHVPNPLAAAAYLAARKPSHHRLVITHHSDIVRQATTRKLVLPMMRMLMERADAIVATSPDYLESSEELARFKAKCEVIPYGIDLDRLRPTSEHLARAEELRRASAPPVTLAVGRLIYYKGFDVAVRAMTEAPGTLVVVGDGPLRTELETLAAKLGVASRVHFVGEVHNHALVPYYLSSDILVMPSVARSEAFGIVQLEAMACGVPVVNTQLRSGVTFASRDGETGLTVPPGDVEALAAAIRTLSESHVDRKRYGAAAEARARTEFAAPRMVARHWSLYGRVCGDTGQVADA